MKQTLDKLVHSEMDRLDVQGLINTRLRESNQKVLAELKAPTTTEAQPVQNNVNAGAESSRTEAENRAAVPNRTQTSASRKEPPRNDVARSPTTPIGSRDASPESNRVLRGATDAGGPRKRSPQPTNRFSFDHPGIPRGSVAVRKESLRAGVSEGMDGSGETKNPRAEFAVEKKKILRMECSLPTAAKAKRDLFDAWCNINNTSKDTEWLNADQKRWLEPRLHSIKKVRNCIKVCFGENESEFFGQSTSLPSNRRLLFKCPRQEECMGEKIPYGLQNEAQLMSQNPSAGTITVASPRGWKDRNDFFTAQNRLKDLECRRSSSLEGKRDVLDAWRKIATYAGSHNLNKDQRKWMESRHKAMKEVEHCIQSCFDGDEKAFYHQVTSLPLAVNLIYTCQCQSRQIEKNGNYQLRLEFEAAKKKILEMERFRSDQATEKKALYDAWEDVQRFSGKMKYYDNRWLKSRASAI